MRLVSCQGGSSNIVTSKLLKPTVLGAGFDFGQ